MSETARWVFLVIGVTMTTLYLSMLIRQKLSERNTLVWMIGTFIVMFLAVEPSILDKLADWAGIYYPPNLLFLVSILTLSLTSLYNTSENTKLQQKIQVLTQTLALHHHIAPQDQTPKENNLDVE